MDIIEAFATKNKCYQAGAPLHPRGLMLHSIVYTGGASWRGPTRAQSSTRASATTSWAGTSKETTT